MNPVPQCNLESLTGMGVAANIGVSGWSTYGEGLLSKCVPILPTISHMPHGCPASYTALTQTSDPRHRWRQAAAAASGRNQGGAEHASWGRSHDATGVKRHSHSFRREAVLGRVVPRTERSPSVVMGAAVQT